LPFTTLDAPRTPVVAPLTLVVVQFEFLMTFSLADGVILRVAVLLAQRRISATTLVFHGRSLGPLVKTRALRDGAFTSLSWWQMPEVANCALLTRRRPTIPRIFTSPVNSRDGGSMTPIQTSEWRMVAEQASKEMDSNKLTTLIDRLCEALDDDASTTHQDLPPAAQSPSPQSVE
jgi:hypothetical protein